MLDTTHGRGPQERTEERQAQTSRRLQELSDSRTARTDAATNNRRCRL